MKKFIENLLIGLIVILSIFGQPVFAANDDLNSYVYNHLENWDTEFQIPYYESDALEVVKNISEKDDYLARSISRLVYEKVGKRATVKITYRTTKEQEKYINTELTRIVNSIITPNMSDFEKVKAINNYIIDRYSYDESLQSNNVYSALTTGKTICQGYAMTAYKMLNLVGIENRIIIGELDGVAHGWNLVKLNGKWYHLDITNNDAVDKNRYFLKNDDALRNDGFVWKANDYPACNEDFDEISNVNNTRTYVTGWNTIDNKWYYLESNGEMKTGWLYYNKKWYYCYPGNGTMAINTIIDGYRVDSNGVWIA